MAISTHGEGISHTLAATQSVMIALAAVGGLIVAVEGLDTWHKQIRGRTDYDMAMRIGRNVIDYKNLLLSASALSIRDDAQPDEGLLESSIETWKNPSYSDAIRTASIQLRKHATDAELLWESEAFRKIDLLLDLGYELSDYATYLRKKESGERSKPLQAIADKMYEGKRDPILRPRGGVENAFETEVRKQTEQILSYLRRFLDPS